MNAPQHLIFSRTIDTVVPLPSSVLRQQIYTFKPSLSAQHQMTVMDDRFILRYGSDAQMKIWMIGTFTSLDNTNTRIIAQIGIDRYQSNLKYVAGLSGVVAMMAFAEALDNDFEWGNVFVVGLMFVVGFWILIILGMVYSQARLRNDFIQFLSVR